MNEFSTPQILFLLLLAAAVTLAFAGVGMMVFRSSAVKGRLVDIGSELAGDPAPGSWRGVLARVLEPISRLARPRDDREITGIRAKFSQAGWRGKSAPALFFAAKAILALLLPFLAMIMIRLSGTTLSQNKFLFLVLCCAAFGYYLPNILLANRISRRTREIFEAFPDATDLIIVCVEAGLGLDMAIARTGREMAVRSAALADEMQLIGIELRMGATRERALRNFATRTGVSEISLFVAMILQADRFGTSIAESLRIHAESLRLRRRLRAEEAAAKIPLKLLFPLIFMVFPSLLLVLLGPAFISISRTLRGLTGS